MKKIGSVIKSLMHSKIVKFILPAVILAAIAAAFAVQHETAVKADRIVVKKEHVEDWYKENGTIKAGEAYTEIAKAGGRIRKISAAVNMSVKKGDVIVEIDPSDYEYEKAAAEAVLSGYEAQLETEKVTRMMTTSPDEYISDVKTQYESAKAAFDAVELEWKANSALYASGDISRLQYENTTAAYEAARSAYEESQKRYQESARRYESLKQETSMEELNEYYFNAEEDALKAQIESEKNIISNLEDTIANCTVKAGRSGIITALYADKVSAVQQGTELFIISDRSRGDVFVEADILTSAAGYIKVGSPVTAKIARRGQDMILGGKVQEVYGFAEKSTSSLGLDEYRVHVKAALENAADVADLDGYGVELSVCLYNADDVLVIPASAAYKADDRYYVFVPENGKAAVQEVTVEYSTGTTLVISGGISEGDTVIDHADSEEIYEGVMIR